MIFSLRQIQEKCIEQYMQLYAVFIDSTEALDTVSREGLWIILKKFGCTEKVLNMSKALHEGMQAQVVQAKLKVPFRNLHEGIYIQTRHGADLTNVSHFKAKTRTTRYLVREMLFVDDTALVAHNAADIQLLVDDFARAAAQFSLEINIKKKECLLQPVKLLNPPPGPESIMINQELLVQSTDFTYLGSTITAVPNI
ncbi:hypothetical protein AWC38_SpisGene13705 [Stylophora pistillata]|uniref:Reverse transcriptase domain-containing protein n=1 Tax=Stylophora pistillata TaxID=50429 RepID=A0A2B4RVZ3_STYPI|nr:hypothetical protein AWC38_SpisGene13705 [Stylophora pistillata]